MKRIAKLKRFLSYFLLVLVVAIAALARFRPDLLPMAWFESNDSDSWQTSELLDITGPLPQQGGEIVSESEPAPKDQGIVFPVFDINDIPAYAGDAYIVLDDNVPEFDEADKTLSVFEYYTDLDVLGRCGVAYANICQELMPTEKRGDISSVKPSGWHSYKYDFIDGKYLYNRCHLIGFQLAGENANKLNLITGTRYLNIEGMLPFENLIADYVHETDNHVLYRVTPVYQGDNLVADGVRMEGWSVEDSGDGVCFDVFAYNVQPGVEIDYATGESREASEDLAA